MNKRQEIALWIGIGILILAWVFPPWVMVLPLTCMRSGQIVEYRENAGRYLIGRSPSWKMGPRLLSDEEVGLAPTPSEGFVLEDPNRFWEIAFAAASRAGLSPGQRASLMMQGGMAGDRMKIDTPRVLIESGVVVLLTGGLLVSLRTRKAG